MTESTEPIPAPRTLGELRASGWRPRTVKEEMRANLLQRGFDRVGIGGKKSNVFTPPCNRIKLKFRTTTSNEGTVEVIRPGGEIVSKLARHTFLKRYSFHTFFWDGTNEDGVIQPPGRYKLRVLLEDEGRGLTAPGTIRLHKVPKGVFCVEGKGRG